VMKAMEPGLTQQAHSQPYKHTRTRNRSSKSLTAYIIPARQRAADPCR